MTTPDPNSPASEAASEGQAAPESAAIAEPAAASQATSEGAPPSDAFDPGPPPTSPFAAVRAHHAAARAGSGGQEVGGGQRRRLDDTGIAARDPERGVRSEGVTAPPKPDLGGPMLPDAPLEYWSGLADEERVACYNVTERYFHGLLEDFRRSANEAVRDYHRYRILGTSWRVLLIVLTGGLALVNVLATSWPIGLMGFHKDVFSFSAAVYAVILALLTNVESFYNFADRKSGTRESRELYLDAYREFEGLRLTHVYPYGYSAQACFNFNVLYQRLVMKDLELRRKIMHLSEAHPGASGTARK